MSEEDSLKLDPGTPRRLLHSITIPSAYLEERQRRTAVATILLPTAGTAAAVVLIPFIGVAKVDLVTLGAMYLATTVGLTVGYHRHFTHRAFAAPTWLRALLAILGSMAAQGPVTFWVAAHRRHHMLSDREGDSHSPQLHGPGFRGRVRGLWHAHIGWMLDVEITNSTVFAKDMLRDPLIVRLTRYYIGWVILGLAIPAVVCGVTTGTWLGALRGFLWGGLVRIFLVHQVTWGLNSLAHVFGAKTYHTADESRNLPWLAMLTLGEGWHNNHHAFPRSAKFGLRWYQLDIGYWVIATLRKLRCCSDVKEPDAGQLASRKTA